MTEESATHVPPMILWGYSCGSGDLIDVHFDHLSNCCECQTLVCQFIDVLEEIAAKHRRDVA
jgi:hypothetical protein